jgi:hypothetical protein
MGIQQLKKSVEKLKTSFITKYEPACKIFVFDGLTTENGLTDADVEAYSIKHPQTHIVTLFIEDMGASL